MTKHIGRIQNVGIGKESTRGTAVSSDYFLCASSVDFWDKVEYSKKDCGSGVIAEVKGSELTGKWAEGSIEALIGSKSFGLILLATLGSVSSATKSGETAVYEHTFTLANDSQHQSLTVERKDPNGAFQYALTMVNSMEITFERGKVLNFSVDLIGKSGASATVTASYSTENVFRPQDFGLTIADSVSGLGSGTSVAVESFKITFEKNAEPQFVLGDTEPTDILNKNFNISGEFTLVYDSTDYRTWNLAGTNKAMRIAVENTDVTIGTASHPKFTLDLEPVALEEVSMENGLNDLVKQTITFFGQYNTSTSKIVDNVVLTNTEASY